jgi:hypothetical protein
MCACIWYSLAEPATVVAITVVFPPFVVLQTRTMYSVPSNFKGSIHKYMAVAPRPFNHGTDLGHPEHRWDRFHGRPGLKNGIRDNVPSRAKGYLSACY